MNLYRRKDQDMPTTEPATTPGVDAGQLIADTLRRCSPRELEILGVVARHHTERCMAAETYNLAELWHLLVITADHLLSEHPAALNTADLADLDQLGNTPTQDQR